jgi:hypothetical protein
VDRGPRRGSPRRVGPCARVERRWLARRNVRRSMMSFKIYTRRSRADET